MIKQLLDKYNCDAILFTEWWKTFILDHIKNIEEYKNKNTLGK